MGDTIESPNRYLAPLVCDIKNGEIRIPDFQRAIVWRLDQVYDLLDSVQKGFPIGSILLWETTEKLNERDPLNLNLKPLQAGQTRQYLLDGQQRLITLYSITHNKLEIGKRKTMCKVFYDLKKEEFWIYKKKDLDSKKAVDPKIEEWFIPMDEILKIDYSSKSFSVNNDLIEKLAKKDSGLIVSYTNLFTKFNKLSVPAITTGQKLKVACKIFERLNTSSTPLTIVDVMVASTYNKKFNLREKLEELNTDLDSQDFSLSDRTILQCMSACFKKGTTRDHVLDSSEEIEAKWKRATQSIRKSIDFLKEHCSVPVSNFIPNEILLAPLTYFFYKSNKQLSNLSDEEIKKLRRYFLYNVLSQRYIQSQDSKAEQDISSMEKFLEDSKEKVFYYPIQEIDSETIKDTDMSFGSAFAKTILCFFASKKPLEFENNQPVRLDRSFADANLKQLHHIFPVNFVNTNFKKDEKELSYVNSIVNISLISQTTNRKIWNKKPSLYFEEFEKQNKKDINVALKSHLITDFDSFGLKQDDFKLFIDERAKHIVKEIKNLIESLK